MSHSFKLNSKLYSAEFALVIYLFHSLISSGVSWVILGVTGREIDPLEIPLLAITGFAIFVAFLQHFGRLRLDSVAIIGLFFALYLISSFNPDTAYQIRRQNLLQMTFVGCIPAYILFRMTESYEAIWKYAKQIAYLILVVYGAAFFVYDVGHVYRSYSAGMMLPATIFTIEWLYLGKKNMAIPAFLAMLLITVGGRRSSLVAILLLVCVILISKRNFATLIVVVLAGVLFYVSFDYVVERLYYISTSLGIHSRTLRRMVTGDTLEDSHRFEQWAYVFKLIFQSPQYTLFGLGAAGERSYFLKHFIHMELQGYPHGLLVEMIAHYGIFAGLFLDVLLVGIGPYKALQRAETNVPSALVFLMVISLASSLLFQDSYLQNQYFFVYIAVMYSLLSAPKEGCRSTTGLSASGV